MNSMHDQQSLGTVLIMAGGTGGHIFPALCVAEYMRARGYHIEWLGTEKGLETQVLKGTGIRLNYLSAAGLRGKGLLKLLTAPLMISKSSWQAMAVIKRVRPCCVLGLGGYVTGPGGVAAKLLGKKLVIHEQNAIPGFSNNLLSRIADRVLEAFPDSFRKSASAVCTGNPVRDEIRLGCQEKNFLPADRPLRVLVLGGSLGAVALNTAVPAALKLFADEQRPELLHQAGGKNLETAQASYAEQGVALGETRQVMPFIADMSAAYAWADVVICRAGAATVSELAVAGVPAILVPYPHAVDDHQTRNAQWLTAAGAAVLLPQNELVPEILFSILRNFSENRALLQTMSEAGKSLAMPEATEKVAAVCMEMCHAR